ncbi:MAG TPA: aminoglycoside phosphotransferase family protein [Bdellovibrionales bacterium]|nr:aminoglycoside phosphotransferase family protein [Bdellovibrionales bacterium]
MTHAKPEWRETPADFKNAVERALGAAITGVTVVDGGYTNSAAFHLKLDDGRDIFCKADHPGATEFGRRSFHAEREVFQRLPLLAEFSPRYLGDLPHTSWPALFFEWIGDAVPLRWVPGTLSAVVERVARLHATRPVPFAEFAAKQDWSWLFANPVWLERFAASFEAPAEALGWFRAAEARLKKAEAPQTLKNDSLLHLDLRSDNILLSASRGPLLIDWPYVCAGPAAVELGFFAASIAGEGGPGIASVFAEYERIAARSFSRLERQSACAIVAGFLGRRFFLPPLADLPGLRRIQRAQFMPALEWMAEELGLGTRVPQLRQEIQA